MTAPAVMPIVAEAFRDTLPMVPVLFVLYTALEILSHQQGSRLLRRASMPRAFGPAAGALLGVIPQCGVSVFMTSLFLGGRVTTGTLVATYLATSDEAIPVLLAHGRELESVFMLVGIKLLVGGLAGSVVDAVMPLWAHGRAGQTTSPSRIQAHVETEMREAPWNRAIVHGFRRALEIFAWVLALTIALGVLIEWVGLPRLSAGASAQPALTLVGAAVLGLIPNCSVSIAIAEAYLAGVLPYGATVAGLCTGAGYGPILLLRRGLFSTATRLLTLCLLFAVAAGLVVTAYS